MQLHQGNTSNEKEHIQKDDKNDIIEEEPRHELTHLLSRNTKNMAPLDTGSTFNLTNDEDTLINMQEAISPMTSRTNMGQRQMIECGEYQK